MSISMTGTVHTKAISTEVACDFAHTTGMRGWAQRRVLANRPALAGRHIR
jgi:hypothetical protein